MANIMPELLLRRCSRPLMKSFAAIEDSSVLWWGETVPQLPPPPRSAARALATGEVSHRRTPWWSGPPSLNRKLVVFGPLYL